MVKLNFSTKRLQISKANASMIAVISGAVFVVIFCLIAIRALMSQRAYQSRVIAAKQQAKDQVVSNLRSAQSLATAYQQFVATPQNLLGGNPKGTGDKDGDNAKLILDALPSKYDFPALASSLEKILGNPSYKIKSITGVDQEVEQQSNGSSPEPTPIEMPFEVSVDGSYPAMQNLVATLEHSIRPFQIQTIELAGNDSAMNVIIDAKTYYQPEKSLSINKKVVK